jgi:hypothetical protein
VVVATWISQVWKVSVDSGLGTVRYFVFRKGDKLGAGDMCRAWTKTVMD